MKRTGVMVLGLAILLGACGEGGSPSPEPARAAAAVVAGSFVGKVPELDALVAVVSDGERVRAYLCDGPGRQVAAWAEGDAPANGASVELVSRDGARFAIDVKSEAATGKVTLPDGRALSFTAARATGAAGLYELTLLPDGTFGGGSTTGGSLAARVRDQQQLGPDRVRYTVAGTVVAPDGTARPIARHIEGTGALTAPITLRAILTADGQSRGRGKGVAVDFVDRDIDL